ncbi:MAG: alpha/beta hydrolase [Pyrinomonadaceae bacterium]
MKTIQLASDRLARETVYCAILPGNYENSTVDFPVLYLLHGLSGRFDNWLTNTKIVEYAKDFPGVIVCADGGDNWYADAPHLPHHSYESYFFDELFPAVERNFKVGKNKSSRAIAGLSMGGYGAFKFAFRRPEMFCFAASMSGAFHAAEVCDDAENEIWREIHPSVNNVFSDENVRAENNLFQIAEDFPADKISELPFFYFDCGRKDVFLKVNRRLNKIFQRRGIAHEFRQFAGGHDWNYWDEHIVHILKLTAKKLLS